MKKDHWFSSSSSSRPLASAAKLFRRIAHRRANIWSVTILVMFLIVVYIMIQLVGLTNSQVSSPVADASIKDYYNARIEKLTQRDRWGLLASLLSPTTPQSPPAAVVTDPSGSGILQNPPVGQATDPSVVNIVVDDPSIFTKQDQGPSAPLIRPFDKFGNVPAVWLWAIQGKSHAAFFYPNTGRDYDQLNARVQNCQQALSTITNNPPILNCPRDIVNALPIRMLYIVDWGDGKQTTDYGNLSSENGITAGEASIPRDSHSYANPGVYSVTAKACYGRFPMPTGPGVNIRNPGSFQPGPLDGRCSAESHWQMRVVTQADGIDPVSHATTATPKLAGPQLIAKLAPNQPNEKSSTRVGGYPTYKIGNNIPLGILRVINVGETPETIRSILIEPSGISSIPQVRVKLNGEIIGDTMQKIMVLTKPVSLSVGQSVDLQFFGDANINENFASAGPSSSRYGRGDDIFQSFGISGLNVNSLSDMKLSGAGSPNLNLGNFELDNNGDTPGSIQTN